MKRAALLAVLGVPSCLVSPHPAVDAGFRPYLRRIEPVDRPPHGLWEVDQVAHRVALASGRRISGMIEESLNPNGPVASIQAMPDGDRITVNPHAAREIPPNAWAFIFGHEFAHQVYDFGHRGHTDPAQELRADIIGAGYAKKAGYELVPYLHWMLSCHAKEDQSHGDLHERARALARHFRITTAIE